MRRMINELNKPLKYLIGSPLQYFVSDKDSITEVPYDCNSYKGLTIAYCNLLDEKNSGKYQPYLKNTGTAEEYNEGLIDPSGPGFIKNLEEQLVVRKKAAFKYVELDNPDSYPLSANMRALSLANDYGFKVIAKNPGLGCSDTDADEILKHPAVVGIIVEKGAGTPESMNRMRVLADKMDMPVWFVFFGKKPKINVRDYNNMWASYSPDGEYSTSIQIT